MAKLLANSHPAERNAGCTFSETFENNEKVAENDVNIVGAPTINRGATLDGTSDYLTIPNIRMGVAASIRLRFIPTFASDDGVAHAIWDTTTTGGNYRLLINTDGTLRVDNVNTAISGLAYATWSPHWNEFGENEFMMTYPTTKLYLNGVYLGGGSKTGTDFNPDLFYLGVLSNSANKFAGEIKLFQVFDTELTAEDALNYWNNSQFTFRNRAVIDLPMGAEQHDATNFRTLDVSSNSVNAILGAGDGGVTTPTKLAKQGYSFDGGDYLLTGELGETMTTLSMVVVVDTLVTSSQAALSYEVSGGTNVGGILLLNAGVASFFCGSAGGTAAATGSYNVNERLVIIGVHDGTDTKIYVNGVEGTKATNPIAPNNSAASKVAVGARVILVSKLTNGSNVYDAKIYDFALSAVQREQIMIESNKKVNDV